MKTTLYGLLLPLLIAALPAAADDATDREALAAAVRASITSHQSVAETGVAVAVLKGGKIFWTGGFGERDRERHLPVTEDTLFGVASTTKAFAATLLAQQAHDGLLALDEPVNGTIPGYELRLDKPEVAAQITVEDMLSHRSGLPRHDLLWVLTPFGTHELLRRMEYLGMNEQAGDGFREAFQYNNLMFMAASEVSATVGGAGWTDLVTTRLLQPLGMDRATFDLAQVLASEDYALGYFGEGGTPYVSFEHVAAAGGLNASARDMARWVELHLKRGIGPDGRRLVSAAALENTYRPRIGVVGRAGTAAAWSYGLGWFLGELDGERVVEHGGNTTVATSSVTFLPELGIGVVVLTNQAWSSLPARVAADVIKYLRTGGEVESAPAADAAYLDIPLAIDRPVVPRRRAGELEEDAAPLRACVGSYVDPAYGELEVIAASNSQPDDEKFLLRYYGVDYAMTPKADGTVGDDDRRSDAFTVDTMLGGLVIAIDGRLVPDAEGGCSTVEVSLEPNARAARFEAIRR